MKRKLIYTLIIAIHLITPLFAQDSSIYIDFRNQKIADIIYSLADISDESVFIDETVTGSATFHFEDSDFISALNRFANYTQLNIVNDNGVYKVSKVLLDISPENKISINTENVLVEPFLNYLSRQLNTTIMYDSLPNASVTIRVKDASIEDILNLVIVKLPGFALERIASGYYLTKSSGSVSKRNMDIFTISKINEKYSLNVQKATFASVIETLFRKAGKEYSSFARTNLQIENLSFKDKDFDDLLALVLEQANCDYTIQGNIYYILEVQKKDLTKNYREIKVINLNNISCDSFLSVLPSELNSSAFIRTDKDANRVILYGTKVETEAIESFIEKIDLPLEGRYYTKLYLNNISIKDCISSIPKELLLSSVSLVPKENAFITQVTSDSEKALKQFVNLLDSKKTNYPVKLKYITSEELLKNLPPTVTKDNIIETTVPTSVFFTGSEQLYNDFINELQTIDIPKQQIKYQLLVIQRQKSKGINTSASINALSTTSESGYSWNGMLSNVFNINFDIISQFGVQFATNLNAEISEGKSNVLADTTLNGISGQDISFSNTNTFRYRDIIVDAAGDIYTSTTREIASGLTLKINGWVSGDEMITVKVDAQVSKQGNIDSSSNANSSTTNPPSTSEKKVSTNVRTKSGEPVIIGGLFQNETDVNEKRIPVLGKIPLLGNLFKTKTETVSETEFVIYLVPFVEKNENRILSEEENLIRLKNKYRNSEVNNG